MAAAQAVKPNAEQPQAYNDAQSWCERTPMKQAFSVAILLVGLWSVANPAAPQKPELHKEAPGAAQRAPEVEELDRQLSASGPDDNWATFKRLVADDCVFVAGNSVTGKAEELESSNSSDIRDETDYIDSIDSRRFGDTVVLWGRTTAHFTRERRRLALSYNFTDVWQKRPSGWQQVYTIAQNIVQPEERQARFEVHGHRLTVASSQLPVASSANSTGRKPKS
jgi:hypothetical protein